MTRTWQTRTGPTRTDAAVGDRVVVRYRKGPGAPGDWRRDPSATASDVTGTLVADTDDLVISRDGEHVRIPRELVLAVRALSDRAVRGSEIRALECAAARGWPGTGFTTIDGWFVRSGSGFSRRANSAVPLGRGATLDADTVARLRRWFADHDLVTRCAVVERLIPAAHVDPARFELTVLAMTRDVPPPVRGAGDVVVEIAGRPDDAWVGAYLSGSGRDTPLDVGTAVVTSSIDGTLGFASVTDAEGLVAIGRAAVTNDRPIGDVADGTVWVGISCLWTAPRARGAGIGTAVVAELMRFGAEAGATQAYLQVESGNKAAIRLYRRLGFIRHHTYGYITL